MHNSLSFYRLSEIHAVYITQKNSKKVSNGDPDLKKTQQPKLD